MYIYLFQIKIFFWARKLANNLEENIHRWSMLTKKTIFTITYRLRSFKNSSINKLPVIKKKFRTMYMYFN